MQNITKMFNTVPFHSLLDYGLMITLTVLIFVLNYHKCKEGLNVQHAGKILVFTKRSLKVKIMYSNAKCTEKVRISCSQWSKVLLASLWSDALGVTAV